jgi:uncharacterized protein YgbK (DUF1537 family)
VIVADATDESDLDRIVAEAMPHEGRLLWAGSAGLVAALARALPAGSRRESLEPSQMPGIFCIGSDHKVTVAQVEALLATGNAKLVAAEVPRDTHAVFAVPRGCDPRAVRDVLAQIPAAPLVLSGGDTASLVCRAIGASGIDLYDEILPGIPRGVLRGGEFDGRAVATKSGGFGRPDALIQVAEFLSCPVKQM